MEKNQKILVMALGAVLIFGTIIFVIKKSADRPEKIRIGFIGPLTGELASLGETARAGVELAIEEINNDGGVSGKQIEVIYKNSKCDAASATKAAQELIEKDKVSAIIGGICEVEVSAFGKLATDKKVAVISYCAPEPTFSELGKYFFRTHPSDAQQARFAAEYLYNTLKARKIAAIYGSNMESGFKGSLEGRFAELGGKILSSNLTKIKVEKPDYLYIAASPKESADILKQASELGLKTKMLGTDRWSDKKLQIEAGGKLDILYTEPRAALPEEFVKKILAKTGGKEAPVCAGEAYDAAKMLAATFMKVGLDAERVQDELHKSGYAGVSGQIIFDQNGDLLNTAFVVKKIVKGGAKAIE